MNAERLLTRNGLAARELARDLIRRRIGDRIPRLQDFAERIRVGNGTIQAALRLLQDAGSIRVESRGHLGSFLQDVDHRRLWEFAGFGIVMGAMPLPYSRRYEGLASGLSEAFREGGIPFSLSFMRGAENRVQALTAGRCDLVVMSRLAYDEIKAKGGSLELLAALGPYTYVGRHAVLVGRSGPDGIKPGMRVGVDPNSTDQSLLTRLECADTGCTFVEVPYMHMLQQIRQGTIDAAVWNVDEVEGRYEGIRVLPLRSEVAVRMAERNTEAVLVVDNGGSLSRFLRQTLAVNTVIDVQRQVLAGERIPSY